jgi:N-methylhydantoinase B
MRVNDPAVSRDPFLVEVIKDALAAVGDEMFETLLRTSMSPIIYEVLDFASGLTDARGQLITQGNGVSGFLGMLSTSVQAVLEKWEGKLDPGDIVVTNDPYIGGGSHLSDVSLVAPIFHSGRLVAFAASKAHWTEVGGMSPGSFTPDSTEVFQEGLQLPCVKIAQKGRLNQALVDAIAANVRLPEMTLGDLHAQSAAMRVGERRFLEVCDKYGLPTVLDATEASFDHAERLARLELAKLPKGEFVASDLVDDDGQGNGPFPIQVKVTITDDAFVADFTGSHPQVPGPVNTTRTGVISATRVVFKAVVGPDVPVNDGAFRPLQVICPPGTIFSAERPAPVSIYWESLSFASDLVWKALAPHVPERLGAGHLTSVCGTIVGGLHPETGELVLIVEPELGGWGGGIDKDGENGNFCSLDGETYVIPVEVCESRYGVIVERFALDPVGAGAGRHRGGLGCVREYRILRDGWMLTATTGRHTTSPWAVDGGHEGSRNSIEVVHADGTTRRFGKVGRYALNRGDLVRVLTATGGGWGNPLERPAERVLEDARDGYVSLEDAERDYGLRIDPDTMQVRGRIRQSG